MYCFSLSSKIFSTVSRLTPLPCTYKKRVHIWADRAGFYLNNSNKKKESIIKFFNGLTDHLYVHKCQNVTLKIKFTRSWTLFLLQWSVLSSPWEQFSTLWIIWENINRWNDQKANAEEKLASIKDLSHESIEDNACCPLSVERIP